MRFDFAVLGATGMQGKIVAKDLLEKGYSVLLCGRDQARVEHLMKQYDKTDFEHIDIVENPSRIVKVLKNSKASVAINCIEGDWNDKVLEVCAEAGVHSVDLGSDIPLTRKQLGYHAILKKKNLTHITGCGSVPGIGNVMLRHAEKEFDSIDSIDVGFAWDSNMKVFVVPFSMQSITEEFVTPADMVIRGKNIKVKPMDTLVRVEHKSIEKEPQFNVGHHPETYTFHRFTKDKGVKNVRFFAGFPEHSYQVIESLVQLGFAEKEPIVVDGRKVVPVKFLTEVMKKVKAPSGYRETENLWVKIEGKKKGTKKRVLMECIVPTLEGWEDAGCNVDTGMPASIMAQMIKQGTIKERGSFAPEEIVPPEQFFKELKKRKMIVYRNGKQIN